MGCCFLLSRSNCLIIIFQRANLVREGLRGLKKDYERSEDHLKALQSVGQIIGEVLKQLDEERCEYFVAKLARFSQLLFIPIILAHYTVIVKSSSGPRYVVGCRSRVNKAKLVAGNILREDKNQ